MRTTLILDEDLLQKAQQLSGLTAFGQGNGWGHMHQHRLDSPLPHSAFISEPPMNRPILATDHIHPAIRQSIATHQQDIVSEVQQAIQQHPVVVVGMAQNPMVKQARDALTRAGFAVHYLEYGSYFSQWRRRNALKMWTGWPTFPMVFVNQVLIGGAKDVKALIDSGELKKNA
jgi:monothiol glutaredoxin